MRLRQLQTVALRVPRAVEAVLAATGLEAVQVEGLAQVGSRERVLEAVVAVVAQEAILMKWADRTKPAVRVQEGRLQQGVEAERALTKPSVLATTLEWAVQGLFSVPGPGVLAHPWFR